MPYKDPVKQRENWKRWAAENHAAHRTQRRIYEAEYREENREAERAKYQRYYERNREAILARKSTPEWKAKKATWERQRRARVVNAGGSASHDQIMARVAYYGWKCYLCSAPWEHIDHVKALAKDGTAWPANLRPICAACNFSKNSRSLEEVRRTAVAVC